MPRPSRRRAPSGGGYGGGGGAGNPEGGNGGTAADLRDRLAWPLPVFPENEGGCPYEVPERFVSLGPRVGAAVLRAPVVSARARPSFPRARALVARLRSRCGSVGLWFAPSARRALVGTVSAGAGSRPSLSSLSSLLSSRRSAFRDGGVKPLDPWKPFARTPLLFPGGVKGAGVVLAVSPVFPARSPARRGRRILEGLPPAAREGRSPGHGGRCLLVLGSPSIWLALAGGGCFPAC